MVGEPLSSFLMPGTDPDVAEKYATLRERARSAVFGFEDEVAFVDIETTGLDAARDEIVEVAAVIGRGPELLGRWSSLICPSRPVPPETTQLTGIDEAMVADAPPVAEALAELSGFIGKRPIVAHNASFDRSFLEQAAKGALRLAGPWIDSLEVVRIALPRLRSHGLSDIARAFSLDAGRGHRALDDAELLFAVWRLALTALGDLPATVIHELARLAAAVPGWTASSLFSHLAGSARAPGFDLQRLRHDRLRAERSEPLADASEIELAEVDQDVVRAEFDPGGLVELMYEEYEPRCEQSSMAEAVAEAFNSGRSAAVEAGTGVGKSVAYLVPAARFALRNGVAVGVATKTNNLMDQLVYRELPRLNRALGGGLRYTALKGYENYVCLRKLQRLLDTPPDEEAAAAAGMLLTWVAQSSWGDRSAINLHWTQDLARYAQASFDECIKGRCRYFPDHCYLHGARRRAASAHIVVTNHALLFRDLTAEGGILPPIRHWIVDEAHAVETEARAQLSLGAGHSELHALLTGLHSKGRGGLLDAIRTKWAVAEPVDRAAIERTIDEMCLAVDEAATICESFFDLVAELGWKAATPYDSVQLRVTSALREGASWSMAARVGSSLTKRIDRIVDAGRTLVTRLEAAGDELVEQKADLGGRLSALAAQKEALDAVLDGTDDSYVYTATVQRRRDALSSRVEALLLDVGAALADEFYPKVRSVVYTSATIAAGSDFSHFERSVGLDRLGDSGYRTLRLDSSYDFERQMAVFVPTGLPEPCQPSEEGYSAYVEALTTLLLDVHQAMGGSVLTLFTNRREMQELHALLAEPLSKAGLRLLVQRRGVSRKRVAEEFLADESVSLFATKSFWEGFDARGDTLRCVVVPRLPFAPVNDPVLEERKDRDRGWWEHYYLPQAVLELKQAAGRLIRSSTDEGCLVLADARLNSTKAYARRFLEALPVRDVERLPADEVGAMIRQRFGRQTE